MSAARDDDFGWRDVALYIAKFTKTPTTIVVAYDIVEAHRWLGAIHKYIERERKQIEKDQKNG